MNTITSVRIRKFSLIIIIACLLLITLLNVIGYLLNCKYISVLAAISEVNKYQVRSELLMDTFDSVGVCDPEDTAKVWSKGLMRRSAALQYSVMSEELSEEYENDLEETAPNWITGMSSPWVDHISIDKSNASSDNCYVMELSIYTATSTGPAGKLNATLTLTREGSFWRIISITADPELSAYTGFKT